MTSPQVLLVDDEPLVARLYGRALTALGCETCFVEDAAHALERACVTPPDLLLVDSQLPGMSGLALVARLRALGARYPMILVSADDNYDLLLKGLRAGVDDFFIKGMPFDFYMNAVQFWIRGPFSGLPDAMRADAVARFERLIPEGRPSQRLGGSVALFALRLHIVLLDQWAQVPDSFGVQPLEGARLLGVLDRLSALIAHNDGLAHVRRPQALLAVCEKLSRNPAWEARGKVLLAALSQWPRLSADPAFTQAKASVTLTYESV